MKKFRAIDFIVLAFLATLFLVVYIGDEKERKEYFSIINKNKAFASGRITSYLTGKRNDRLTFSFLTDNDSLVNSSRGIGPRIRKESRNKFMNQLFLVVYAKNNPDYHQLLVFEKDFKEWGLIYPDSLKWISNSYY